MAHDEHRLTMITSFGQLTAARWCRQGVAACLEIDDDSGESDALHRIASHATAYLTRDQVVELHEFLGKLI